MKSDDIRKAFLHYFETKGHAIVPSGPLVPPNDPSLLFTNAGMVQFKELLLGQEKRDYDQATSAQVCIRAGGKHNDLENVGYTARHHTMFEMLGNFSFGAYFKKEAIEYCWEFLTKILEISQDKLWISVYKDDQETADIWINEIGVDKNRISYCGEEDNFWTMGDTGPCGPCTEIFYDHGEDIPGGPPGSVDQNGDRYIEIWNVVFTQYDRSADGHLSPLPKPCVDTGMGLERLAAVLEGVHNNYETDVFMHILTQAADLCNSNDLSNTALRVIADHIRSSCFLIADGVMPANEGRGYVLRRIIRRAIRHGHHMTMPKPFFSRLVNAVVDAMGEAYPQLVEKRIAIQEVLEKEEFQFLQTLEQGLKLLEKELTALDGKTIPGEIVFKLYDTYGFPADLTADYAREQGYSIDQEGFEKAMEGQKTRSREASQFNVDYSGQSEIMEALSSVKSSFVGYEEIQIETKAVMLLHEAKVVDELTTSQMGTVVLEKTPFYAESGGQVGDSGAISINGMVFEVHDTQKIGDVQLHYGVVSEGTFKTGDQVMASIDEERRQAIRQNHSATHLLHKVLHEVLGSHVEQKGSLVADDRLRFDFSNPKPLSPQELWLIESLVNEKIRSNSEVETKISTPDEAVKQGAIALFGEKYGDKVRVLTMDDSVELCGGTHVNRTGDIGLFKVINEAGIASGVRRIEAVTGQAALDAWRNEIQHIDQACCQQKEKIGQQEKQITQLKQKVATSVGGDIASQAKEVLGVKVLVKHLEGIDAKTLRPMMDQLKDKLQSAVIVLATASDNKVSIIAGVTKDQVSVVKAGDLVNHVAMQVGGKGGGRADMAQAGGSQPENLERALESVYGWVEEALQ